MENRSFGDPLALWRSGFVNRWHTHPDARMRNSGDTTAAHQWRAGMLFYLLWGEELSRGAGLHFDTFFATLVHDAPEVHVGDMPQPAKRDDALRGEMDRVESEWWEAVSIPWCMRVQGRRTKLCDMLDTLLFAKNTAPEILDSDGWEDYTLRLLKLADLCGVRSKVKGLINA